MPGDGEGMMSRQLIIKLVAPIAILIFVLMAIGVYNWYLELDRAEATRRSDSVYIQEIKSAYPDMKNSFSIANVTIAKGNWVVVEVKNNNNSDTLRTLIYDPTNNAADIQVITTPSTRESFDELMTIANTAKEEPEDVSE